jgi:hypothetical protein
MASALRRAWETVSRLAVERSAVDLEFPEARRAGLPASREAWSARSVNGRRRRVAWQGYLAVAALFAGAGCSADLGVCDPIASERVVYDTSTGMPAYEGQALLLGSCGGGQFCHASGIDAVALHGVPSGFDFDVRLASSDARVFPDEVARLRHARFRVRQARASIWEEVVEGTMPPSSLEAQRVVAAGPRYARLSVSGESEPLPGLDTAAGREVLRNWLACDGPVVERTVARADGVPSVAVPGQSVAPVEANWDSVFGALLVPRCASGLCHGGNPDAGFQVFVDDAEASYAELGAPPRGVRAGDDCRGEGALLDTTNPDASLLLRKLAATDDAAVCGRPMPLNALRVTDDDLANVRAWIAAGAPP